FGDEIDVFGEARFLVPVDAEIGEPATDAERMARGKAAMRLDQEFEFVAERRAHRRHISDRESRRSTKLRQGPGNGSKLAAVEPPALTRSPRATPSSIEPPPDQPLA